MGVVIRQSFWVSALTYAGVALGYVSSLILFPAYLDVDQIGLIRLIQSNGLMLVPVAAMGMPGTLVKYFPDFSNDKNDKSAFFLFQLIVIVAGNLLIVLLAFLFRFELRAIFEQRSAAYVSYIYVSIIILISQSLFEQFSAYCRSHLNIITPGYFKEVHLRLINMIFVVLYGLGLVSFDILIMVMAFNYVVTTGIIAIIAFLKYPFSLLPKWSGLTSSWLAEIRNFGGYILLVGVGNSIVLNLGFLLTSTYLGLEANGIFTTCVYIATVIEMPYRATSQIVSPLYAQHFKRNDMVAVNSLYAKSALNMFLISVLLTIGIFTNLEDLFKLIPKGEIFSTGTGVILMMGISKIVSMGTGTSGELLVYSRYRNFNLLILGTTSILMIILNVWLIPELGINGAALAALLVVSISALARYWAILIRLKMSPFSIGHLKGLIIGLVVLWLFYYLEFPGSPIIKIAIRSILTLIVFCSTIYFMQVSDEVNRIIDIILKRIGIK